MSFLPPPIIFHLINPNELERDKIKILKIKNYEETDTFEMLIHSLLKKYKNLYSKENKLYIGDFTLIYEGISLKMNITLDKVNVSDGEPFILLLNKFSKKTISLQTALNFMNVLFPTQTTESANLSSLRNIGQDSNNTNINTNINTSVIPDFTPPLSSLPPSSQNNINIDKNIQILIDMGFSESIARTAIKNTNSLEEALNLLVDDS
jgi:hypothetical protein